MIENLNSLNGILVNGKSRETAILKSGDVISIGRVNIAFHLARESCDDPATSGRGVEPERQSRREDATDRHATRFAETQRVTESLEPIEAQRGPGRKP